MAALCRGLRQRLQQRGGSGLSMLNCGGGGGGAGGGQLLTSVPLVRAGMGGCVCVSV